MKSLLTSSQFRLKRIEPSRCFPHRNGSNAKHTTDMPNATKPIPELSEKDKERFWRFVNKDGPTLDQSKQHYEGLGNCWEWEGTILATGYGQIKHGGEKFSTHRLAWFIANGEIPDGMVVMHQCDNRRCCRPAHLRVGSSGDNNRDAAVKGRQPSGDQSWSRLHPERLARGERNGARLHPETRPRGNSHYTRMRPDLVMRGERNGMAKLTDEQVAYIRTSQDTGKQLAKKLGVSESNISSIRCGKSRINLSNNNNKNTTTP
jgi:hypothetical protein